MPTLISILSASLGAIVATAGVAVVNVLNAVGGGASQLLYSLLGSLTTNLGGL